MANKRTSSIDKTLKMSKKKKRKILWNKSGRYYCTRVVK